MLTSTIVFCPFISLTKKNLQKEHKNENKPSSEEKKEKDAATATSSSCNESQQRKAQSKECKRCIGCKTVRAMLTWSWYHFQQWLKHKVRKFPDCHMVLASEAYTTMTCSECGSVKQVGPSKMYKYENYTCQQCDGQGPECSL